MSEKIYTWDEPLEPVSGMEERRGLRALPYKDATWYTTEVYTVNRKGSEHYTIDHEATTFPGGGAFLSILDLNGVIWNFQQRQVEYMTTTPRAYKRRIAYIPVTEEA
jgi:hypothetical protein